jgi:hypothetical protein
MALSEFQQTLCQLIAVNRRASGESYVAGGAALNFLLRGERISRDIDLFHDTAEALDAAWQADRRLLESRGYDVQPVRERAAYVEASVSRGEESVLMEWTRDSAYRFFPLVEDEALGLALHPFDLATNKMLALAGRLEVRDWIDLMTCHDRVQPMGYLAWAGCGKDPGFSPSSILEHAARSGRYTDAELDGLSFEGPRPDLAAAAHQWRSMLDAARSIVSGLPAEHAGKCVLGADGNLYRGSPGQLKDDLAAGALRFHAGCIRGAYPQVVT